MRRGVLPLPVKDYLRASAPEFLLCLVASCAIGFANCGAFFVSADLQYSLLALVVSAGVPLASLFAAAYNRRTMLIGGIAIAVALFAACFAAAGASGASWIFEETESNPAPFILIMFFSSLATYLCTRKRWMTRVYLIVAAFELCFVEFLYRPGYWPALLTALIALGAMVVYRNYRSNLRATSTNRVSFGAAFGVGVGYCLVLAGIACALFFLIIAPLNPSAVEFKPFTRYMNYETIEMTGIGDATATPAEDNRTNQTNDAIEETSELDDSSGESSQGDEADMSPEDNPFIGSLQQLGDSAIQSLQDMYNFLVENPPFAVLAIILLIALLSSPYWVKKLLRRRWHRKTNALAPRERVQAYYEFFLRRFKLLGIQPADGMTLAEFADSSEFALAPFGNNARGVTFRELTQVQSNCVYGDSDPSSEDIERFEAFYKGFYRSFVKACGRLKYVFRLRFFRV